VNSNADLSKRIRRAKKINCDRLENSDGNSGVTGEDPAEKTHITHQAISCHMHLSAAKKFWSVKSNSKEWVLNHENTDENNEEVTPLRHHNPW